MLRLTIFLALFVLTDTEDLLGVNYSFDVDFYINFDSRRCDNVNIWQLVRYGDLGVESPFADSDKAIQALGESCASSFPIIFVGGILEITVYAQVISNYFKLSIKLFDEEDECITSYEYGRSSKGFAPGWRTISLEINKHVQGYIHLRGNTLRNELLLIDSFRYIPNDTISYNDKREKRSIDNDKTDEAEIIFKYKVLKTEYNDDNLESSGDGETETEQPPPATDEPITEDRNTIWNPFTISMVSFGAFVIVLLCVVGAYHYGRVRARNDDPLPFDAVEPPRPIIIPRAGGRSNRINTSRYYDY